MLEERVGRRASVWFGPTRSREVFVGRNHPKHGPKQSALNGLCAFSRLKRCTEMKHGFLDAGLAGWQAQPSGGSERSHDARAGHRSAA